MLLQILLGTAQFPGLVPDLDIERFKLILACLLPATDLFDKAVFIFTLILSSSDLLIKGDSELLDDSQSTDKVLFKPSSDVTRGGCLLDTHYGLLDARRETKAKLLKRAVTA